MTRLEEIEIERLVGEIAEEGTSADRIGRLNSLLKDNVELQRHYAKVMALHTMLAYELNLSLHTFAPLVLPTETSAPSTALAAPPAVELQQPSRTRPSRTSMVLALASVAAAIAIAMAWWPSPQERRLALSPEGNRPIDSIPAMEPRVVGSLSEGSRELILTDEQNLRQFSRATNTTPLERMLLPVCSAKEFPASLSFCSGTVWMQRPTGQRSRGYMLPVRSGATIELKVEAASSSQNALSVVEIDMYGRMTGSAINFSNMGEMTPPDQGPFKNLGGPLGKWSQRNDSSHTKYYLFTGTHSLRTRGSAVGSSSAELQYVSDYRVLLDLPDLVYIGWDDSGYATDIDERRRNDVADYDFDDIAALVRIVGGTPQYQSPTLEFEPQPEKEEKQVARDELCYPFVVPPQTRAVLLACSDAFLSNSLEVVDASNQCVLWRLESLQPPPGERYTAATEAYHIHNGTDEPAAFYLQGMHQEYDSRTQDKPWVASPHRELVRDEDSLVVGFEDSTDPSTIDWNDVQVQIRFISLED